MYEHQSNHLEWNHKPLQRAHFVSTLHNNIVLYTCSLEVKNSQQQCQKTLLLLFNSTYITTNNALLLLGIVCRVCFVISEDVLSGNSIKLSVKAVEIICNAFCSNFHPWNQSKRVLILFSITHIKLEIFVFVIVSIILVY